MLLFPDGCIAEIMMLYCFLYAMCFWRTSNRCLLFQVMMFLQAVVWQYERRAFVGLQKSSGKREHQVFIFVRFFLIVTYQVLIQCFIRYF